MPIGWAAVGCKNSWGCGKSFHRFPKDDDLRQEWIQQMSPKTIFFWAPTFKWGLVFAGLADYARPADKLSLSQSAALAATGTIWARYSTVIIPKNWNLFAVNFFLGLTGIWQLARIYQHKQNEAKNE